MPVTTPPAVKPRPSIVVRTFDTLADVGPTTRYGPSDAPFRGRASPSLAISVTAAWASRDSSARCAPVPHADAALEAFTGDAPNRPNDFLRLKILLTDASSRAAEI